MQVCEQCNDLGVRSRDVGDLQAVGLDPLPVIDAVRSLPIKGELVFDSFDKLVHCEPPRYWCRRYC